MQRSLALLVALALTACAPHPAPQPLPPQLAGSYVTGNPFARILRGELPVAKVYEDAQVLAFMDTHPVLPGHVLVISKTSRARNLLEVSPADLARMMAVVRRVARAELVALNCDGVRIEQNNGSAQTVFHLHIHVIPHMRGDWNRRGPETAVPVEALRPLAAKIAAAMQP